MNNFIKQNKTLVLIIINWIVLTFYLCLKLFFGYYIELACSNENFINLCNFIDNNKIISYLVSCIFCYFMLYFYYCGLLRVNKLNLKQNIILILTITSTVYLCDLNYYMSIMCDLIKAFIIPLILMKKPILKNLLTCIIVYGLNFIFQLVSLVTRNMDIQIIDNSLLISSLFSIDVIIMLILFYLYRLKKEVKQK